MTSLWKKGLVLAGSILWGVAHADPLTRFLQGTHTLSGKFQQTVTDERQHVIQTGTGLVWIARPDHFRWNYQTPYAQQIVGNGRQVSIYDQDLEQVTVRPLKDALGETPALLLAGGAVPTRDYSVTTRTGHGALTWVDLVPRRKGSAFSDIRFAFAGTTLARLVLKDSLGQTTDIRFYDVHVNVPMPAARFRLSIPPGTDVLHE